MVASVVSLVLALVAAPAELPEPDFTSDPLVVPLTPHTLRVVKELACPDGSTIEARVHEFPSPPQWRIAFTREGRLLGVWDRESGRIYIVKLQTVLAVSDDRVPTSPCDLPDPGVKT